MAADRNEYKLFVWENNVTPLNAANLNRIESGIIDNNKLSLENAAYLDELCTALIEQLSITYNHETNIFTFQIGTNSGDNPTTRFYKKIPVLIETMSSKSSAEQISYDNYESDLKADNVQDAIDEIHNEVSYSKTGGIKSTSYDEDSGIMTFELYDYVDTEFDEETGILTIKFIG